MFDSDPTFLSALQSAKNEFNRARRLIQKVAPIAVLISRECPELFDVETPRGKYNYDTIIGYLEQKDYANMQLELERLMPHYQAKIQKRQMKRSNPHDL